MAIEVTVEDRTIVNLVVGSDIEVMGVDVEVDASVVGVVAVEVGYMVVSLVTLE